MNLGVCLQKFSLQDLAYRISSRGSSHEEKIYIITTVGVLYNMNIMDIIDIQSIQLVYNG